MKEVSKNPSGFEGKNYCGLKKRKKKWTSEREAIERTVIGRLFDRKELREVATINISFVSKETGYRLFDRTFKVIKSMKNTAQKQATRGDRPARFVPVVVIGITKVQGV